MTIKEIKAFDMQWAKARTDRSEQSDLVSFKELKGALATLKGSGSTMSRANAAHAASTFASQPVLTGPAKRAAYEFLQSVGARKPIDATTVEAIKAEFSLRATAPFQMLAVPGRAVRNTVDLPDAVARAAGDMGGPGARWANVEVRRATLAGQSVFIVHHSELGSSSDVEQVQVFSAAGVKLALGSTLDPMIGFRWS